MEFTVISAEREQLLPDKEQSWWAPCWRQEIPTAGAVGAWSRSGGEEITSAPHGTREEARAGRRGSSKKTRGRVRAAGHRSPTHLP